MDQYTRILKNFSTVQANATNIEQSLKALLQKFNTKIPAILAELDNIKIVAALTPQQLSNIRQFLHKSTRELKVELNKPLLQLQKQNYKLLLYLKNRILPFTNVDTPPANEIKQLAQPSVELLEQNQSKIQTCLQTNKLFLNKISQLQQLLETIKLPQDVKQTIKKVQQTTKSLLILNAKLLEKDKMRYRDQLQGLQEAISALGAEADNIGNFKVGFRPG